MEAVVYLAIMLIAVGIGWILPVAVTYKMAGSRNRSAHFVWLPVIFGWLGAIIAIAMLVSQGKTVSA